MGLLNLTDHRSVSLDDVGSICDSVFFCAEAIDDRGKEVLGRVQAEPSNFIVKLFLTLIGMSLP